MNVLSLGCSTTGIYLGVRPELTDHPGPKSLSRCRRLRHCKLAAARTWKFAMKALLLYVLFVVVGATIAVGIGYVVEMQVSSTVSLIVFLALFFANFALSWLAVIFVMDGTLKNAQGRQDQLDIERSGRAALRAPKRPA